MGCAAATVEVDTATANSATGRCGADTGTTSAYGAAFAATLVQQTVAASVTIAVAVMATSQVVAGIESIVVI